MRNIWQFVLLSCITIIVKSNIHSNDLITIIDQFRMFTSVIYYECFTIAEKIELLKKFSDRGDMINFYQEAFYPYESFITCTNNLTGFSLKIQTKVPVVVISKIESEIDLKGVDVLVGEEIYFLDSNTLKLYEAYVINQIHVIRYLGYIYDANNNSNAEFVQADDFVDSLVERRGNFHGLQLIGMLEKFQPGIYFPDDFAKNTLYNSENDTYDLTKIAKGTFIDVLNDLERSLNFTTKLFKRKDGKWGIPHKMPNGSVFFDGQLQSVVEGPAHLICLFANLHSRIPYLDFLPPITTE